MPSIVVIEQEAAWADKSTATPPLTGRFKTSN